MGYIVKSYSCHPYACMYVFGFFSPSTRSPFSPLHAFFAKLLLRIGTLIVNH